MNASITNDDINSTVKSYDCDSSILVINKMVVVFPFALTWKISVADNILYNHNF